MGWFKTFMEKYVTTHDTGGVSIDADTVIIDISAETYLKELAVYTAVSLISNAISRSEIKCFVAGKPQKNQDYYLLNVSPNKNETSSLFWHKVINTMVRGGEALVVNNAGKLYVARSFTREEERPILGDTYSSVDVGGGVTLRKKFNQGNSYLFKLDNIEVNKLITGMFESYDKILQAAASAIKRSGAKKYKLHIDSVKAGDAEFQEEYKNVIQKQLREYLKSDDAVYPEFDGYTLTADETTKTTGGSSNDFIALRNDVFKTVAGAFHIPDAMMTGNINNLKDVINSFLTFGVDPFADNITEALNKCGGVDNYLAGNYYKVDTGKVKHRDIFELATAIAAVISSATLSINEVREEIGWPRVEEEWADQYYITRNFAEIGKYLEETESGDTQVQEKGGVRRL